MGWGGGWAGPTRWGSASNLLPFSLPAKANSPVSALPIGSLGRILFKEHMLTLRKLLTATGLDPFQFWHCDVLRSDSWLLTWSLVHKVPPWTAAVTGAVLWGEGHRSQNEMEAGLNTHWLFKETEIAYIHILNDAAKNIPRKVEFNSTSWSYSNITGFF